MLSYLNKDTHLKEGRRYAHTDRQMETIMLLPSTEIQNQTILFLLWNGIKPLGIEVNIAKRDKINFITCMNQ